MNRILAVAAVALLAVIAWKVTHPTTAADREEAARKCRQQNGYSIEAIRRCDLENSP